MIMIYQHTNDNDWGYWPLDTFPDTIDYKDLADYLVYYRREYPDIDIDYDTYEYMTEEDGYYKLDERLA